MGADSLPQQQYPQTAKSVWNVLDWLINSVVGSLTLGDGTTAGFVNITVAANDLDVGYLVDGRLYNLAPGAGTPTMADHFDCSAFTDLIVTEFSKVLLEVDAAGTGYATAGVAAASQALAKMPARTAGRCVFGWLQANAVTDWDAVGGLAGEGVTYQMGLPLTA